MNSVVVVGRVGQDPEMKYFESGKVKTTFSVAVNRWDSKSKEKVTDWFSIDLWDRQAELAGEYVKKGSMVAIDGRLALNKWKGNDGTEREKFLVIGNKLEFLPGGKAQS